MTFATLTAWVTWAGQDWELGPRSWPGAAARAPARPPLHLG